MNPILLIAENKIREAIENGEFDNLPGQGKAIDFSEDEHIPPEYRMAHRILKNSGHDDKENNVIREVRALKDEAKSENADSKTFKVERLKEYKEAMLQAQKYLKQKTFGPSKGE